MTNRSFKTLRTILFIISIVKANSLELRTHKLTNASVFSLTGTDNTTVDSAGHAVLLLDVQLRKSIFCKSAFARETTIVDRGIADITLGGGIDNVSHLETLDGLILQGSPNHRQFAPYQRSDRNGCISQA